MSWSLTLREEHRLRVFENKVTYLGRYLGLRKTKLQANGESYMDQVAQAARRLATGWTTRVRFRVSEGWRFFFIPPCPDWS